MKSGECTFCGIFLLSSSLQIRSGSIFSFMWISPLLCRPPIVKVKRLLLLFARDQTALEEEEEEESNGLLLTAPDRSKKSL